MAISLNANPAAGQTFGIPLRMVPLATNSLNGDATRTYLANSTDAADDLTAGYISSTTKTAIDRAFSQTARPQPSAVKIGSVDLVGGDVYGASGLAAIRAADDAFYGVCMDVRSDTEVLALAAAVEATGSKICAVQVDNADLLSGAISASTLAALSAYERTLLEYHDTDTEDQDFCHLAVGLSYTPDTRSAPWTMTCGGVAAHATALTSGQRAQAITNNVNIIGTYGGTTNWIDGGKNTAGREMRHIVTHDWLAQTIEDETIAVNVSLSNEGRVFPVSREGQAIMASIVKGAYTRGAAAGHFKINQYVPYYPTISAADIAAQRVPFEARITLLVGGRLFSYTLSLTTSDVIPES
ncbi:MAG TPA: hypothetical protein VLB27_02480 [candidate division Zixibacteria bacterium]|nr:hypothetical protein [candidate division Zixibacteria bacterium]